MPVSERLATIFLPGISTANTVSAISGRGVGMDVVRTNLQTVGGTIDLDNVPGAGLTMTMRLPLTLSIISALSVRAGDQIFGVARSSVAEILSVSNSNVTIETFAGQQIANVRGRRLPYGKIEDVLQIPSDQSGDGRILIIINPAVGSQFALEVAAVLDNEELVIKPGAPLVMASGLYSGTSLPDSGRPMLLLDASGLAAEIGTEETSATLYQNDATDALALGKNDGLDSAIMFTAMDGMRRAIRLSAVDRLEDVPAAKIKFVGGKMRVVVDSALTEIFDLADVPNTDSVQMLRLTDGEICKYLAVNQVLDIFSLPAEIVHSANPAKHEGIIKVDGEPVELLNIFQFFEMTEIGEINRSERPLCFVECGPQDQWERRILEPLLTASGYVVSFNEVDRISAQIIIGRDDDGSAAVADDARLLRLRQQSFTSNEHLPSIYRYDRVGLISAIETKLSGTR
jgi:two-component system chemotaxis sensor kinase CheA